MSFTLAIIGRPNVGKSTLFNRLVGKKLALVDDRPGVTRDRREGEARLADLRFTIIDTAGLEEGASATLAGRMRAQTEAAIDVADAILFMIDARAGVTPDDKYFADLVRRAGKPVILVANKAEGRKGEAGACRGLSSSASAIPCRSRPSMARASANSTTRCSRRCPRRRSLPEEDEEATTDVAISPTRTAARPIRPSRCASPSSAGPTPANRR